MFVKKFTAFVQLLWRFLNNICVCRSNLLEDWVILIGITAVYVNIQ